MILSTYEQERRMRRRWSDFRVLDRGKTSIHWEGILQPRNQPYKVEILHRLNRKNPRRCHPMPKVTVIEPFLDRRPSQPDPIPHVYINQRISYLPLLCLYDPASDEWYPGRSIADTIVPWTAEWLWCYECWHMTGTWPEHD